MNKYIYISLAVILFFMGEAAANPMETNTLSNGLPSEATLNKLNANAPSLKSLYEEGAPEGGGPALGEEIIPVGNVKYLNLLAIGVMYVAIKQRKSKHK